MNSQLGLYLKRLSVSLVAFQLSFFVGAAQAEDIGIFAGLTGDGSLTPTEFKPNVLFLLDTSGSMATAEPQSITVAKPPFNPDDFTTTSNDLYLYTSDRTFTGQVISESQNNCKAATDFFADPVNALNPEYFDQIAQWQYKPSVSIPNQDCKNFVEGYDDINSSPKQDFTELTSFTGVIEPGRTLEIWLRGRKKGQFRVYYLDSSNNRVDITGDGNVNSNDSISSCGGDVGGWSYKYCTETVPTGFDITGIQIFYKRLSGNNNSNGKWAEAWFEHPQECVSNPTIIPAAGDWVESVTGNDYSFVSLECSDDYGEHGGGASATTEKWPQRSESTHTDPSQPNFVSSESNPDVLTWNSTEFPEKYLVTAKYHEYLQKEADDFLTSTPVLLSSSGHSNTSSFCSSNPDKYVEDSDGRVYHCIRRIETLKRATEQIIDSMQDANVGVARFNRYDGGSVIEQVRDLDGTDVRAELKTSVRGLPASGNTPLQESLYTSYLYFAGKKPINATQQKRIVRDSGNNRLQYYSSDNITIYTDINDQEAIDDDTGNFVSPIKDTGGSGSKVCQDNSIILFSDGAPTSDASSDVREAIRDLDSSITSSNCTNSNGACLDELAGFMANNNVNASLNKTNRVYTYTVGYALAGTSGNTLLKAASNAGRRAGALLDSQHQDASDVDTLVTAFRSILRDIRQVSSDSFVAPAVAVNAFNRLQFRNDLYFAVFKPKDTTRWNGNFKKYKVNSSGEIIDQNGNKAIGEDGFFADGAVSEWTTGDADGSDVLKGGAARRLTTPPRKIYASLDANATGAVPQLTSTTDFLTKVTTANINIGEVGSNTVPGSAPAGTLSELAQNRLDIIDWTFGKDVEQELGGASTGPNFFLGESLHGTPFVIDFGVEGAPQDVLFASTNQGLIHAFNGQTGDELWSYVPDPSLFRNLGNYFNDDESGLSSHRYGVDGEMLIEADRDADGKLTAVEMFVGQRRGGKNYFALDLTDAKKSSSPIKKKWTVSDDVLTRLGQTWAKPVTATINYCAKNEDCAPRKVVVLAGGYDLAYDEQVTTTGGGKAKKALTDIAGTVKGNAIYMVDRDSGKLLWVAGKEGQVGADITGAEHGWYTNDEMNHSFPTPPTMIDGDFDGIADFMYALDVAGRIWRFDFSGDIDTSVDPSTSAVTITVDENDITHGDNGDGVDENNEVSGGIIARLSDITENRRFFNPLDISLTARSESDFARYNIVAGSGNRPHPIDDEVAENNLYFVFDRNVSRPKYELNNQDQPIGVTYEYVEDRFDASVTDVIDDSVLPSKENSDDLEFFDTIIKDGEEELVQGENYHGFHIALDAANAEKMLNPTLTDDGQVLAVSYSPEAVGDRACQNGVGTSFLYQIDLVTGRAARLTLSRAGISAPPVVIEIDNDDDPDNDSGTKKILIIGSEAFDASGSGPSVVEDDDIDELVDPGLGETTTGSVQKVNWWERSKR